MFPSICAPIVIMLLGSPSVVNWKLLEHTLPQAQKVCLYRFGPKNGQMCLSTLYVRANGMDFHGVCGKPRDLE